MNAFNPPPVGVAVDLEEVRDRTYGILLRVVSYLNAAQVHLRLDDDAATLWDIEHAKREFRRVLAEFEPVRAAMRQRTGETGGGA
jgi:hypothetical protein